MWGLQNLEYYRNFLYYVFCFFFNFSFLCFFLIFVFKLFINKPANQTRNNKKLKFPLTIWWWRFYKTKKFVCFLFVYIFVVFLFVSMFCFSKNCDIYNFASLVIFHLEYPRKKTEWKIFLKNNFKIPKWKITDKQILTAFSCLSFVSISCYGKLLKTKQKKKHKKG